MVLDDFLHLMPLLILVMGSLITMLVIAVKRYHKIIYIITMLSLIAAFASLFEIGIGEPYHISPLFIVDGFAIFYIGLILLSSLVVAMLSYAYFEQREERKEEYYILHILATLGACVMVISKHFGALFLGLEVLSVSLYGLVAYLRTRERSDEAGIKYLILAAMSSAFLLFGMALVYAMSGSMGFYEIGLYLAASQQVPLILIVGFGLMVVGIGFKLGVVPFHMWTPDVYEGAPAPVTAFIATVSKGGMVAVLIRFFMQTNGFNYPTMILIFTIIAIASMFAGNILALMQNNVKRILAYSSIAHLGYILVAFLAGNAMGIEAVTFYLVAYFITSLGAFGIITLLSDEERDAEQMEDYRGLLWRRPWTAAAFTAMLLSLAGIPLTAGFVGKFFVLAAGVRTELWLLVVMLALNSVIGLYYYIKIVAVMFSQTNVGHERQALHPSAYLVSGGTIALLAILLIYVGVYPAGLMQLIEALIISIYAPVM
ncbi:NADH-quinone oxidoreductase subunit N [Pontibacter cellulosilyticus]|uniref:NADH-quinone oxidoreductase subunit N n=1 Tax=Pontibacter cellulosilyticus TaxID=1720253 RepID=A0A923SIU8_9BACT|nr:NADH-quinone oxidoreductase subunit N [Pontibacter cellulosilyticus]MBC5992051.1 NADH-quinone oxidoreductase subunit N [Pontibacter cellulosilyticus]